MAKIDLETRTTERVHVRKADIKAGLAIVGLKKGHMAFVHSSLSKLGYVEGGADTVIDALLETVGPEGTIVMPTFAWTLFHDKKAVVLDVTNTAVKSEVGIISETFRKRKGVIRSRHICHSVAAIGPHAKDVMGEGVRSFGPGSTFDRLYQSNSWNLFLGVGFSVCTALHMVEEHMRVPYREYRDFRGSTVILPDGSEIPSQSVEYLKKEGYHNDFEKMGEIFSNQGILRTCKVGEAKVINVKIRDIFDVTKRYMEDDIGFLLTPESLRLLHANYTSRSRQH